MEYMDYLAEYNFEGYTPFLNGDTFEELEFEVLITDPDTLVTSPLDLTNYEINWQFRKNDKNGKLGWDLSLTDGLALTDPTNGKFKIEQRLIDMTEGTWYHDCRFYNPATLIALTYYGGTVEVKDTATEP